MTLLATLTDADLGFDHTFPEVYKTRVATRAFLYDAEGNIACVYSSANRQHKIPGGGVEDGEALEQTLAREMWEEAGCNITNVSYIGYLEERRGRDDGFLQISHLYQAHVDGPKQEPAFDENEIEHGFSLKWLPPQQVVALLNAEAHSDHYGLNFQNARERKLLEFLK